MVESSVGRQRSRWVGSVLWEREKERERECGVAGLWDYGGGCAGAAACALLVLLGISQCASITVHQM